MTLNDELAQSLGPVAHCFQSLGVRFYVGGSVASSFHGAMRSTMDVDLVAELNNSHVQRLLHQLADSYYASESAMRDAIQRCASFNLIHLETSFKIDIFVSQQRPFDLSAFRRARSGRLGAPGREIEVPLASVEDMIIAKLLWYRLGNDVSEQQWDDVNRLVNLWHSSLDQPYLNSFCQELNIADLLVKLISPV